jgi:hypothetical protein
LKAQPKALKARPRGVKPHHRALVVNPVKLEDAGKYKLFKSGIDLLAAPLFPSIREKCAGDSSGKKGT